MTSAIGNIASSSDAQAHAAVVQSGKSLGPSAGSKPKVMDIKPVEIQFDPAVAHQNLRAAVSMLNDQMVANKQGLGFAFDPAIHGPVIRVSNLNTGEVVRQIPTEDVLHMAHKIEELKGILFNKAV